MPKLPFDEQAPRKSTTENPVLDAENRRNSSIWAKSASSQIKNDFDSKFTDIAANTGKTEELTGKVLDEFDSHVTDILNESPDATSRNELRDSLDGYRGSVANKALQVETLNNMQQRKDNAVIALESSKQRITKDPNALQESIEDISSLANLLPPMEREAFSQSSRRDLMLTGARSAISQNPDAGFQNLEQFQTELSEDDLKSLKNDVEIAKSEKNNENLKNLSRAKTASSDLFSNASRGMPITIDQIAEVEEEINKTGDLDEIARFKREKDVLEEQRVLNSLSPTDLKNHIKELKNAPKVPISDDLQSIIDAQKKQVLDAGEEPLTDEEYLELMEENPDNFGLSDELFYEAEDLNGNRKSLNFLEKNAEKSLEMAKNSPLEFAAIRGNVELEPFNGSDPQSVKKRIADARYASQITGSPMQVLTSDEVLEVSDTLQKMEPSEVLKMSDDMAFTMGDDFDVFLQEIGENNPLEVNAISISKKAPNGKNTAKTVLDGMKLLRKDPNIRERIFPKKANIDKISQISKGAFPSQVMTDSVQNTADAYYTKKIADSGRREFDEKLYEEAVRRAVGGTEDERTGIRPINGLNTVLPAGITDDEFEDFVSRLPEELQDFGTFHNIGGGVYSIKINGQEIMKTKITPEDIKKA